MRIITGTVKSTPKHWLPVLCNIFLFFIRRKSAGHSEWTKNVYIKNKSLPIHQAITHSGNLRLKSGKPTYINLIEVTGNRYDDLAEWKSERENSDPDCYNIYKL